MLRSVFQKTSFFQRSAVLGFAAAGLFCACTYSGAQTVPRDKADTRYEEIDLEEGRKRLESFRAQRLDGDYCFRFQLEHMPRRGKTVRYAGTMWGTWNEQGPLTRVQLDPGEDDANGLIDLILQNGPEPKVWNWVAPKGQFELLGGAALHQPIVDGVIYTPFDLQMPFIYWNNFEYAGTARVSSRIVQQFLMLPPQSGYGDLGIGGVRIGLDDTYDALFRVDVLDAELNQRSRFTVESWKKLQGQYIVKQVTLKDDETKDRTRFRVRAASVGLILADGWFDPLASEAKPTIPESMFEDV